MQVKGYELVNEEKVTRAIEGTVNSLGIKTGGILKEDGTYDEDQLLAEYDKLGGLITRGEDKLKIGCFYDFLNKKQRKTPEIIFVYNINGKVVEVKDGTELPGIVKAARILEAETAEEIKVETKKGKKSKK